jgi:hypothetical protein
MDLIMPDDKRSVRRRIPRSAGGRFRRGHEAPEVTMCNFELSPEMFRQRRIEMIALADERRLARAMNRAMNRANKPVRVRATRSRGSRLTSPVRLDPSPVPVT